MSDLLGVLILVAGSQTGVSDSSAPADLPATIETVCVDKAVTRRAVANPTNQKVVSNARGIFLTYLCNSTPQDQTNRWRLMHSTDQGRTFCILHQEVSATKAPTLDTDQAHNLYLCWPDFSTRGPQPRGWFYRFAASDRYRRPLKVSVPRAMAGKFAAAWDSQRRQAYFWVHSGWFSVLGADGQLRHQARIVTHGPRAYLQYPLLCLDSQGVLYAAWTTWERGQPAGRPPVYWDIHSMRSRDGGLHWESLDGRQLELPQAADETGSATRITADDEFELSTWLAAMVSHRGKLHFCYKTQAFERSHGHGGIAARQHYVRYDQASGRREIDLQPEFRGERLVIRGAHCLLAADASRTDSPLYCVGYAAPWLSRCRLVCLASDDAGHTWYDYAASRRQFTPTGLGGCRELASDGGLIGSFTDLVDAERPADLEMSSNRHGLYFFRIQAGRSLARAERVGTEGLRFVNVRGQPRRVRFRHGSGIWSDWSEFQAELTLPAADATAFQLRSSLGVDSAEFPLPSLK